jgi:hypothetical protein
MRFYLGIHRPNWLAKRELADVPVFISRRTLIDRRTGDLCRTFPRAVGRYAIDSGGFTELQRYGRWTTTPAEYVRFLRRAWDEIGPFDFAAPMDWMCEPAVIEGGEFAGLTFAGTRQHLDPDGHLCLDDLVGEHQRRTVANFGELRDLAPDLPIAPVVQGWTLDQYLRCVGMYRTAGVDLIAEPVVCVGSVCRRQNTDEAAAIVDALRSYGLTNLHGFGFKIEGLRQCWSQLSTADSLSWSKDGRHAGPCQHPPYARGFQPKSEANCLSYALAWLRRHIQPPARPSMRQLDLFGGVIA